MENNPITEDFKRFGINFVFRGQDPRAENEFSYEISGPYNLPLEWKSLRSVYSDLGADGLVLVSPGKRSYKAWVYRRNAHKSVGIRELSKGSSGHKASRQ